MMRAHENAQEPTTINATAIINARAINSYKAQKCDFLIEPECMCVFNIVGCPHVLLMWAPANDAMMWAYS
jgi:hypothetical protein